MRLRLAGIALMAAAGFAQSQTNTNSKARSPSTASTHVVIVVASIKPSDQTTCREYPIIDDHNDTYDMRCVKAKFLIQTAFNVRDFQISGGPAWLESTQYDIAAKIESSP